MSTVLLNLMTKKMFSCKHTNSRDQGKKTSETILRWLRKLSWSSAWKALLPIMCSTLETYVCIFITISVSQRRCTPELAHSQTTWQVGAHLLPDRIHQTTPVPVSDQLCRRSAQSFPQSVAKSLRNQTSLNHHLPSKSLLIAEWV